MSKQDYYQVLGVDADADAAAVKESYRRLAFRYHPDRNREAPRAADKMKQLNEAYAVLSDPEKRRRYDRLRHQFGNAAHERFRQAYADQDIFSGTDIHQIFEEMANAYGIRGFDEVFREFYGRGRGPAGGNRVSGKARGFVFDFPAGAGRDPQPAILPGRGGRLIRYILRKFVHLQIPEDGADINDTIRLSPELATSGGPYAYYHRQHDKKLIVQIPASVQDDQRIRLQGQGQAGRAGGKSGDLFLKVRIRKPLLSRLKALFTGG